MICAGAAVFCLVFPQMAIAQEAMSSASSQTATQPALLLFRPTCLQQALETSDPLGPLPDVTQLITLGSGRCPNYPVSSPTSQDTPPLAVNDTVDMEIILINPAREPVRHVRAWLSYDPSILEGIMIEPGRDFPVPTPGEADFSPTEGFAKIQTNAPAGQTALNTVTVVARVRMRVKAAPAGNRTPIGFYDLQQVPSGHTAAVTGEAQSEKNILSPQLGTLNVMIRGAGASSPSSVSSSSSDSSASMQQTSSASSSRTASALSFSSAAGNTHAAAEVSTPFPLLQVQSVRATTEGGAIYIAWDRLRSAETAGYNVYYGTQAGRYIQRRSVDGNTLSLAIRGLVAQTTYYIAVRAFNAASQETAFSQEVAVRVSDPQTSTSPLRLQGLSNGPGGKNPLAGTVTDGDVPGETGTSSSSLLLFLSCAVIGTLLALRRQWIAVSPSL